MGRVGKFLGLALIAVALSVVAYGPLSAQCADCVAPGECGIVEHSAHNSCQANAGEDDCIMWGLCIIIVTEEDRLDTPEAALLASLQLDDSDVSMLTTEEWGKVPFSRVGNGLHALWSCSGDLAAVAKRSADGSVTFLDVADYSAELSLQNVALNSTLGTEQ